MCFKRVANGLSVTLDSPKISRVTLTRPQSSLMQKLKDAKDDGKVERRETTGRSCFQDGGRSNGGFEIKVKATEKERFLAPYDTTNYSYVKHLTFRTFCLSITVLFTDHTTHFRNVYESFSPGY